MNLFVFGDSYAVHSPFEPWTWVESVRSSIGATLHAHAVSGSALEWVYHCFEQARGEMREGDIILICPTSFDRRWFFQDMPGCASLTGLASPRAVQNLSQDAILAARNYYKHLDNTAVQPLHLINWLEMVGNLVARMSMRCLVIPSFREANRAIQAHRDRYPSIDLADGDLFTVYYREVLYPGKQELPGDPRRNHICRDNHELLSRKVLAWIRDGSPVTMDDFVHHVITPEIAATKGWESRLLT